MLDLYLIDLSDIYKGAGPYLKGTDYMKALCFSVRNVQILLLNPSSITIDRFAATTFKINPSKKFYILDMFEVLTFTDQCYFLNFIS